MYLYLKTHNATGLKYLGKTIADDPYEYQGSGKVWQRHIKKHGYDVTTEILLETQDETELIERGIYYSKLWDVVSNNEFANLIPESGDGGAQVWTQESRQRLSRSIKGVKKKDTSKMKKAQQKRAAAISEERKAFLKNPENLKAHKEAIQKGMHSPLARKKAAQSISQLHWWNNGIKNTRSIKSPGDEWKLGRIR